MCLLNHLTATEDGQNDATATPLYRMWAGPLPLAELLPGM